MPGAREAVVPRSGRWKVAVVSNQRGTPRDVSAGGDRPIEERIQSEPRAEPSWTLFLRVSCDCRKPRPG